MPSDKLYAGDLFPQLKQYTTHVGLTINAPNERNIAHDVRQPMPIPAESISVYQAEDVFEHISYAEIPPILEEIYRVLKPNGLFRLSVPDYRCDILRERSLYNRAGDIVFDPGGGGKFDSTGVIDGGHVWFPQFETVKTLLDTSPFTRKGTVSFLHYTQPDGVSVMNPIDYGLGFVKRTPDHDSRVANPRRVMSIVVDARKD